MKHGSRIGRYQIVGRVGEGGLGAVYQALDTRLGRTVALKFLHARLCDDRVVRSGFRREASIAASLSHPSLCTVHDFDEHDGRPYIVMEFLGGRPLSDHVREGFMSTRGLLDIATQIAGALAAAHRCGIVHRDIKPANVLVCDDGTAKLVDFGVAQPCAPRAAVGPDDPTAPQTVSNGGSVVGTVGYMSPEQARGAELDERSDLFSLGVVLYEMAAGVRPFDAPTLPAVFDQIFHVDPPSPRCLNPALPERLAAIILKALRKSRSDRQQSADELLDELNGVEQPLNESTLETTLAATVAGEWATLARSA